MNTCLVCGTETRGVICSSRTCHNTMRRECREAGVPERVADFEKLRNQPPPTAKEIEFTDEEEARILRELDIDPRYRKATSIRSWHDATGEKILRWANTVSREEYEREQEERREAEEKLAAEMEAITDSLRHIRPVRASGDGPERAVVLGLADLQIGKSERTERLVPELIRRYITVVEEALSRGPVTEIVLGSVGDGLENLGLAGPGAGHIFEVYDYRITSQARKYIAVIRAIIEALRRRFPHIPLRVVAVRGNHGRTASEKGACAPDDNWDTGVFEILSDFIDDPLITWQIEAEQVATYTEHYGYRVRYEHGDKVSASKGRALYGLQERVEALLSDRRRPTFHVIFVGHHHSPAFSIWQGVWCLISGALDGGSKWYTERTGRAAPDTQVAFSVVKGHGPTDLKWIDLGWAEPELELAA